MADGPGDVERREWQDRHGELFAYMHAQLLARYDAERHSVGLSRVVALNDYTDPIDEGYDPGTSIVVKWNGALVPVSGRSPGAVLSDLTVGVYADRPGAKLTDQAAFRERLLRAAASGTLASRSSRTDLDINTLSERTEPTDRANSSYFGALHNDGHLHIGLIDNDLERPGFMYWETVAICDPVFFRWHRHINDLFRARRDTLERYDFADRPPVTVLRFDVRHPDGQLNELWTEGRTRPIPGLGPRVVIPYLSHPDFKYEISVAATAATRVTFRLFMVPADFAEDYTAWIEMDKFVADLTVGDQTIERAADASSVVRHPVTKSDCLERGVGCPDERGSTPGCRCGWPYTLLLPRGWEGGMPCVFMVMASPGDDITAVDAGPHATSYCGVQDAEYPDRRPMGYPFDRPFLTPIVEAIDREASMARTEVMLRHNSTP